MADGKDTIINTNADSIILRKGSSYNTLFKISETSTSLGYGSHSIGLNTISIGSNAASLEESPIEESQIMDGKLVVKNVNRSIGDINEIVIPVPPAQSEETVFLFNKFKISKPAVSTAGDDYINLVELQIWIKDAIGGIRNIAPLFTKIDGYDGPTYPWGPPKAIINEEIDTAVSGSYWHSDAISGLDFGESYAHYTTNTSYNAEDIVAIVIYNRPTNNNRLPGIRFDLMSEHNTLYSYTFVDQESVTRLDGPALSSVDVSYFTSSDSTTLIKDITAKETMEFALSELDPIVHIKLKTSPIDYADSPATIYINIYTSNDIRIGTSHEFFTDIDKDELKTTSIRLPKLYNNIKVEFFTRNNNGLYIEKIEIFYIGNIHQFTQIDGSNPNSLKFGVNNTVGWLDNNDGHPNSRKYTGINYYDILQNFNIVRVLRTTNGADAGNTTNTDDVGMNRLECNELQLWIKDADSNIINIAPNGTHYADITRSEHHFSNINNEIIEQNVSKMFIGSTTTSNGGVPVVCTHHFKITLDSYYNINDVAAIVWYNLYSISSYRRAPGASIQLLHDDRVLYTHEIGSEGDQTNTQVFKVHGPALPSNYNFANGWSTSSIIKTTNTSSPHTTPYLLLDTISTRNNFSSTLTARIKKVRVRRVADQGFDLAPTSLSGITWQHTWIQSGEQDNTSLGSFSGYDINITSAQFVDNVGTSLTTYTVRDTTNTDYIAYIIGGYGNPWFKHLYIKFEVVSNILRCVTAHTFYTNYNPSGKTDQQIIDTHYSSSTNNGGTATRSATNTSSYGVKNIVYSSTGTGSTLPASFVEIQTEPENRMNISEIQFWVNGTNVASNGSVTAGSNHNSTDFAASNVLGGTFALLGGESWLSDSYSNTNTYDFITVTLQSDYNVYDIQSVVVYGPEHSYDAVDQQSRDDLIKGCSIELLDASDNILYENEVIHGARYSRFDGPSLNTATFSTTPSTTNIIGNTGNLRTYTILNNSNYINAIANEPEPGSWSLVFRQTVPYLWTSGNESSALENMKLNQLNTESDDNYSIMNEIYNSDTRDKYKYNGSFYKFKMVNSEGYELTWSQPGNPFDYTDAAPGTIRNVISTHFPLSYNNNQDFDGLHYSNNLAYTILDGITGAWIRYTIGQTANSSAWSSSNPNKLVTISTDDDQIRFSDWVELYVYMSEAESEEFEHSFELRDSGSNIYMDGILLYDYTQHSWNTFVIANIDPNDIDFFKNDYIITWEDNPIGNQHGGYYLNYNNRLDAPSDLFIRAGGPTWWWYSDNTSQTQNWSNGQGLETLSGNLAFRKLHRMIFRFIDNTTWSVSHTYDGLTYTTSMPTYDGWTFSDKRSIQLNYHAHTSYTTGHHFNLRVKESEPKTVLFHNIKNGDLTTAQNWLTSNYPEFNFSINTSQFGHNTNAYLFPPTTDDVCACWNSGSTTSNVSFTAYMDGYVTIVYGGGWSTTNTSPVSILKNDVIIDEDLTSLKKTFVFDVSLNDEIKIRETVGLIYLHSIKIDTQYSRQYPEREKETILFQNIKMGDVTIAQNWLDTYYSYFNFKLVCNNFGHQSGNSGNPPLTDDVLMFFISGTSEGSISFTAYMDGYITIVYGGGWSTNDTPVYLKKNDVIIDQDGGSRKKKFIFDVSLNDRIKLYEDHSVINLYSIKFDSQYPERVGQTVLFENIKMGPDKDTAQSWLNHNYSDFNFLIESDNNTYAFGHNTNQYLTPPLTDDVLLLWENSSPAARILFTAYMDGYLTIIYGGYNGGGATVISKNDVEIDRDNSGIVKKKIIFDVSQNDQIKIEEINGGIIYLHSISIDEQYPERIGQTVLFKNIKMGPDKDTAQSWLNHNYSDFNFVLTYPNIYFGHVQDQYITSPTTDDACIIWSYLAGDSSSDTGTISFTAYMDGYITIVYGCAWSEGSAYPVKILKNDVIIDTEDTSLKKLFVFDVSLNDAIKIEEDQAVKIIYSIKIETEDSYIASLSVVEEEEEEETVLEETSIVDPSYSIIYNPDTNEATYTKYFDIKIDSLHTELQSNINNLSLLEVEFETLTNSFNIIDTSFNLRKTNDDISLNINDVSLNVFETRYINLDTSFNILDTSFNLQKPNVDASLNIHDISLNILEPTIHDISLNISKFDVSFNELVSQGGLVYTAPFSIGSGSTSSGINSFAIGPNASTGSNDNSVAIGNGTIGTENNIVLGGSTQSVIMNNLNIGDISFGDVGYGADWSGIQNRNDSEYALIQKNTGETLINSHDDSIIFRIDNADYMRVEATWGLYCNKQINSTEQPLWVINSTTAGNQSYGQGGRIGSSVNLGGQSLSHYFNNISKWNTTVDGWDHASGAFFAPEDGIYLVDLYIFCNNATTFDGRCKWSTNAGRNQNGQYNFDVTRDTVNEGCDLHRMTWYATAGKYIFWYVSTTYGPNNIPLTCFLNNGGHTCLRITKIL